MKKYSNSTITLIFLAFYIITALISLLLLSLIGNKLGEENLSNIDYLQAFIIPLLPTLVIYIITIRKNRVKIAE